jgi:hypothetical protein
MTSLEAFAKAAALRTLVCDAVPGCPVTLRELSVAERQAIAPAVNAHPEKANEIFVRACSIAPVFPEDFDFTAIRPAYFQALAKAAAAVNGYGDEDDAGKG